MLRQLKALFFGLLSLGLTLESYEYDNFDMPNVVYPIYVPTEEQLFSPYVGWNSPLRGSLGHTEGNWYDVSVGYTTMSTFVSLVLDPQGGFIPFLDMRGHVFNDGKWAYNIGGGFRTIVDRCGDIFGANVYYDYRESRRGQNLNQIGFGFEFLSPSLDIRLNFYFNAGNTTDKSRTRIFDDFIGPYFATCRDHRRVLSGGDLEFGSWLFPRIPCQFVNLYGAFAPYYYSSTSKRHHSTDGVYGITGRLMTLLGEYFTLELRAGYDRSYKGMVQGTLTFELPLDQLLNWDWWCGDCCRDDWRLYQPVVRQEMIVLSPKNCCWESNF